MQDLNSEGCSVESRSSEDLEVKTAKMGGVVGISAEDGVAVEDVYLGAKEISEDSTSENSDWSGSERSIKK